MGDEKKTQEEKLSLKTGDELMTFLMDLQGQIGNMQETIDKLSPVTEEETPGTLTEPELPTEEEISEIDKLLQGN